MNILPSFPMRNNRYLAILTVISLIITGFALMTGPVGEVEAVEEDEDQGQIEAGPLTLKPGQRSGDHYLDDSPAEYLAYGDSSSAYFGGTIEKLDFNGDGITDLAIGASGETAVYIYDGSYQLRFPNLRGASSDARWRLSGSNNFGTDFAIGDVNGDGYDDILIVEGGGYYSGTKGSLYHGGPHTNSYSSFAPNATFYGGFTGFSYSYSYYGQWVALGDMDGDGYDDVLLGDAGYARKYYYGYPREYTYVYGQVRWWFGSDSLSGSYSHSTSDGFLLPELTREWGYWSYKYYYHYGYTGGGGVTTGDMNGDGRDEVAFGSPYAYYGSYTYQAGNVFVMYPGDTIRSYANDAVNGETMGESSSHADWTKYYSRTSRDYVGSDPLIYDYNGDDLGDLIFGQGHYRYGTDPRYCWIIDGDTTIPTGEYRIDQSSTYDKRLYSSDYDIFGSHAFGDFDGDGKPDMALGDSGKGEVYVLLYDDYANSTGDIEVTSLSSFTVHAGSENSGRFAHPGESYRYYYYTEDVKYRPLCFLNRDSDGLDDLFIGDNQASPYSSKQGAVYGISNYEMFGIGKLEVLGGSEPDGNTYYAEYRNYTFRGSAWNRWDILGTELMSWRYIMGPYEATVQWSDAEGLEVANDPDGLLRVDPGSLKLHTVPDTFMLYVSFNVTFTLNLPIEIELDVDFKVKCQHIEYTELQEEVGFIKNRFKYVGNLEVYHHHQDGGTRESDSETLNYGEWMPSGSALHFTGMKLVYNGTENFDEPFYPGNELFHMEARNNLGNLTVDNSSSGRNFSMVIGVEQKPLQVTYELFQVGIPTPKVLNSIPEFMVNVDTDVPTAPPGIQVHADAFDDENTVVDNEGDLYVTWEVAGEYNSGIHHYEVYCTGNETILEVPSTFAKVSTDAGGNIDVFVRAVDRVGYVGPWSSSFIFVDKETLDFSNFQPSGENVWFNTLDPEVSISITDVGGRKVIGESVEYSVSYDGGTTYNEWTSADEVLNAGTLTVSVKPMLMEGTENMVKFRAMDEAGNLLESEGDPVNIDVSPVGFENFMVNDMEDWGSVWFDNESVSFSIDVFDSLSGVDVSTVEYRFSARGRSDLDTKPWGSEATPNTGELMINDGTIQLSAELEMGDLNYVQFRARDTVGNPYSYSEPFNIWVNTMPEAVISSPEDGAEFWDTDTITFDGRMSSDVDGDLLQFEWVDTYIYEDESGTEHEDVITLGEEAEDLSRFTQSLPIGEHSIVLKVTDGIAGHEVESEPITLTINYNEPQDWLSTEDHDGDGMPNFWEYYYHLPWESDSNGDAIYSEASHGGMDKEALWLELYDSYKNSTVTVTEENDFDGDGHSDLEEYLAGTDPTEPDDFYVFEKEGEAEEEEESLLVWWLIIVSIVVFVVLMLFLVANNARIKKKLENEAAKDAENQKVLVENALASGGRDRLAALKAASEGQPMQLTAAQSTSAALPAAPTAEGAEGQAQPMQAAPMGQEQQGAQPMQAAPMGQEQQGAQPMQAAPMGQEQQGAQPMQAAPLTNQPAQDAGQPVQQNYDQPDSQ